MRLCAVDSLLRLDSRPMTQRTRFGLAVLVSFFGFTLAHCTTTPPKPIQTEGAVREIKVTVKDQYSPERIVVKKDQPVRLVFYRDDGSECTAQVVFQDFQIRKDLAVRNETIVELTPHQEGDFTFACGMDMMKGKLVVER